MARTNFTGLTPPQKQFVRLVEQNAHRYRKHEVFRDFCEIAAITISNSVDRGQFQAREARYLDIVARYEREEVSRFAQMLAQLVDCLEASPHDALGQIFMALELGDARCGQFFTPFEVSKMMAMMTLTDAAAVIERQGFLTLQEPAAGAGGMVIAAAAALQESGINYQQTMHATAIDIDATACHMAYIGLSLLNVPAIVIHGNALWPEQTWSHWVTPAHVLGFWDHRLRRRDRHRDAAAAAMPEASAPAADTVPDPIAQTRHQIIAHRLEQLELFTN